MTELHVADATLEVYGEPSPEVEEALAGVDTTFYRLFQAL